MSANEVHEDEPISPSVNPSLPCIVGGAVAIQIERQASVRQGSIEKGLNDEGDSGVDEKLVSQSHNSSLYKQPITEETIYPSTSNNSELCPYKPGRRRSSVDPELSSQESCSPLQSPRDPVAEGTEAMGPFYTFLHSKGLGDCCQYFPPQMTLANFARLTEYELINLYDIQSSHIREVVIHTIQSLDKLEESFNEDEEVAALHNKRSLTISGSTPPRSPSPRKFYDASDVPLVISRRLLHRTLSEDMKTRRRRESMPHSHSSHTLNTLSSSSHSHTPIPIQILLSPIMQQPLHAVNRRKSAGCGSNSDFSNLIKIRNSLLGHSAPNLSSSLKDLSISRRSSGRSAVSTPKKMSIVHPRCVSPQTSALLVPATREPPHFASPSDYRSPGSPLAPQCVQNLKPSSESRRWSFASYASSGYSTTTAGSNMSLTSSMEKVNPFFSGHEILGSELGRDRFSSSESNPPMDDDSSSSALLPLPRPRSRSFSSSASIFSPTRSMPMDADSTFMMNSLYRERFPKAVRQMEEKLRQFISENTLIPQSDEGDGTLRFVHKQIVTLAQDCLDKCCTQLLSALYFHELSENLRTLSNDMKSRASVSFPVVDKMIKSLLMIVSRTARLLECLEFDPDEFYCLLEQAEGQAKKTIKTSDIPKYIIGKLCLNRDPLEPILPEEFGDMEQVVLDDDSSFNADDSAGNKFGMKAPVEEDFDYIKQISNGAYGVVWLVRNKYNNQRFALKKLLKANLVLRNQVEQVFTERDILTFADNPFVVSLYGSFETKKHLCLVMEYVEGGDCAALLKNLGPLPLDMAQMYFAETVLALEYIHDYGIVHRDLKPDNLLITNEGHIKLTDFGLSKMGIMNLTTNLVEGILDRESKQFSDRQIFGTPEYIAPEVILREGYGKPVDWWSMGIILYEFLVGCVPFYGETPEDLFQMVLTGEIDFPPEEEYALPPDAQELILLLLERDPLKRLGTTGAREVIEHAFLNDIDWAGLLRQKVEFIPDLEGEEDTSYFDLRADRFPQHTEYDDDDSDEDIMISSFSSCSPRYSKVYQKVQEMKCQQEHESLSRQSSGSSSVFGALTQISSDSGSESPSVVNANEKITPVDFSFDKSVVGTPPEFLKSSLKSNTSTPKRSDQTGGICRRSSAKDDDTLPSDISEGFSKRSASRSVSFDSEISSLSCRDSLTSHLEQSPLVTPTSPASPISSLHKMLHRSDALGPTAAEIIQKKDEDGDDDAFDVNDGQISSAVSNVTTPDSVFPSAPPTPIQFDVIPSTTSYTPMPVNHVLSPISIVTTPVFPSVVNSSVTTKPTQLSLSLPAAIKIATTTLSSTANNPVMPISFTQAPSEPPLNLPQWPVKPYLQITSSSDSASSSSANNSPGSNMAQKSYRKNRPGSTGRLQRNKHPGNMLLTKVPEKVSRPRSRTSPDINFGEEYGERHRSLPEVSIFTSSPSPPAANKTADTALRRFNSSPKQSLFSKGATNSCPVPVPSSQTNKSMFVKSASATQLSLLIPPPSDEFNHPPPNVLLSPTSSASSRDQSPTRDALRRPPYILKKGARGYGFFLKAIRVYSGDGHYYHLNHLVTAVTEGSTAYQAGIRSNFLVTHINNEPVHGLPQPQIVRLIQKSTNMVTLRALPIEETSLKPGVKPPSELRKAKMVTRKAVKKRQSFSKVDRRRQRSSSLLKVAVMRTKHAKQAEC